MKFKKLSDYQAYGREKWAACDTVGALAFRTKVKDSWLVGDADEQDPVIFWELEPQRHGFDLWTDRGVESGSRIKVAIHRVVTSTRSYSYIREQHGESQAAFMDGMIAEMLDAQNERFAIKAKKSRLKYNPDPALTIRILEWKPLTFFVTKDDRCFFYTSYGLFVQFRPRSTT